MLTFIGIISLIILVIAIYQYKDTGKLADNLEKFSGGSLPYPLEYYNLPANLVKDTVYLRVFCDDYLHIYHNVGSKESGITGKSPHRNSKWVGQALGYSKIYRFEVPNFKGGDSLMFYNYKPQV